MPTKFDVFTKIIDIAPCKSKDLGFKKPIYIHLNSLCKLGWIKKNKGIYTPIKNKITSNIFKIIKYCIKSGLNYNLFLSKNTHTVLNEISKNIPNIRPKALKSNKKNTDIMHYLEENQFLLIFKKKPRKGILLKHNLLTNIFNIYNIKPTTTVKFQNKKNHILTINSDDINPFNNNIFAFLSGSAQLEGSTITIGETRELLIKGIYPDKPTNDIQMVQNLNEAMHYVLNNIKKNITIDDIKEINKLVLFTLHRNAGNLKITQNKIQGNPNFKTINPKLVSNSLTNYCTTLNNIKTKKECLNKIGWIHNELQYIHPFSDGNSRTTRMILNWILIKHNIPMVILKMGSFDTYMNLTKLYKKRNDKELSLFLYHILVHESMYN